MPRTGELGFWAACWSGVFGEPLGGSDLVGDLVGEGVPGQGGGQKGDTKKDLPVLVKIDKP